MTNHTSSLRPFLHTHTASMLNVFNVQDHQQLLHHRGGLGKEGSTATSTTGGERVEVKTSRDHQHYVPRGDRQARQTKSSTKIILKEAQEKAKEKPHHNLGERVAQVVGILPIPFSSFFSYLVPLNLPALLNTLA